MAPRKVGSEILATTVAETASPEEEYRVDIDTPTLASNGASRRRMPEGIRKHLIRLSSGQQYLPAAFRLVWFRDECPEWGIMTELVEGGHAAGYATVRAVITHLDGRVIATGMKTETMADFPGGMLEKAETGAIGRALAVAGFGTQFSPELDDLTGDTAAPYSKGQRSGRGQSRKTENTSGADGTVSATQIWPGPGLCPRCHAPEGKRHAKPCVA